MSTSQNQNDQQKPNQWTFNDPYRYPIPRGDEDPLETLLEPLLLKDKIQCDAWTEEVQNLLIFAGLFSAVVTSFVVNSSKDLQPDPNTLLLSHIATLIANATNGTVANIPQIPFSPAPSSYRINALWFASLVLGLTTVLAGIVSLQWIREHQKYPGLSIEEKFSIFCMRQEALEVWYVPQIFAGLPLLLQGALALYLAGLVDYLLGFGLGVAIPGIIFIALSLLFLIATTVLPTLQGVVVIPTYLEITHDLPSPCAYKSPQSQAFRRFVTMFRRSFLAIRWVTAQIQWLIMHFRRFVYRFIRLEASQPQFVKTSRWFPSILPVWHKASWIDFERSWLGLHDCMFLNITDGRLLDDFYRPPKPLYDAIKGIRSIARGNGMNPSEPYLFAQFHFLQDISFSIVGKDVTMMSPQTYLKTYFQLLHKSSNDIHQKPSLLSQMLAESNFDSRLLSEENTLAILDIIDPSHILSPTLSKHFVECNLRLQAAIYSKIWPVQQEIESQNLPHWIPPFALGGAIDNIKKSEKVTDFMYQWALSINSFFLAIINAGPDDPQLLQTFHAHTSFRRYFYGFIHQIYSSADDDLDSEILTVVISTITEISVALNGFSNTKHNFLFYTASYYAKLLATGIFRHQYPTVASAVSTLLEALRNYRAHLGEGVLSLEKMMGIPSFSDNEWWKFLKLPEAKPTFVHASNSEKMGANLPSLSFVDLTEVDIEG